MKICLLALLLCIFCVSPTRSQICAPPTVVANSNAVNIFSPEQEMNLGDAIFERAHREFQILDDAEVNAHLQAIGDRLAKHLPATGVRYTFAVADLPDTNAMALPGGRIFVTRKLISFVRNEDEVAGVIAHELGHAVVRHGAIDMTRNFREILGVTAVGDRRDIFNKYNQFIEQWRTKRVSRSDNHENDQQLEADKLGMYALVASGYDANVYTAFWSRFSDAKKTNAFTDLFGGRRPVDKRLKEMLAALKSLPQNCFDQPTSANRSEFDKWRSFVIAFSGTGRTESLPGLISKTALNPLRTDVDHLKFSPDGQYILAQDSSTVYVIKREPFSMLFRFEATDALPAGFTPDSQKVVVHNRNLRVQTWDIRSQSLVSTYEVAITKGMWQSQLSPDGKVLAAYQFNSDLVLYDVETNEAIYTKKKFYVPNFLEYLSWRLTLDLLEVNELNEVNMVFSPDSKYFLAGRKGFKFFGVSNQETIALELANRKEFSIGGNVKKLLFNAFTFLGPDRVAGNFGDEMENSGIFAFPDGKRLDKFELGGTRLQKVDGADLLLVRPVVGAAVAAYDLKAKKYTIANKKNAFDVYGESSVSERTNGEIAMYKVGNNTPIAQLTLPPSTLGYLRTSSVSADGSFLTVSDRSRGAVWSLKDGERKFHTRGFQGSYFGSDGAVYADFPKQDKQERALALMNIGSASIQLHSPVTANGVRQYGRFMVALNKKGESAAPSKSEGTAGEAGDDEDDGPTLRNTTLEFKDVISGSSLWSKEFTKETPRYFVSSTSEAVVFAWRLRSEAVKELTASDPSLAPKIASMQNKTGDYLLQIIDASTGKERGKVLLETGEGSFYIRSVSVFGDYLVISDDGNRLLVYSIQTGRLVQRFFGQYATVSLKSGMIAVSNVAGRVTVYDLASALERQKITFTKPLAMLQFLPDGQRLFALTTDQTAYIFDSSKFQFQSP